MAKQIYELPDLPTPQIAASAYIPVDQIDVGDGETKTYRAQPDQFPFGTFAGNTVIHTLLKTVPNVIPHGLSSPPKMVSFQTSAGVPINITPSAIDATNVTVGGLGIVYTNAKMHVITF